MSFAKQAGVDPGGVEIPPLSDLAGFGTRGAASLARAGEIVARTTTTVWQKQADFIRHETTAAVTGLAATAAQGDPAEIASFWVERTRLGVETAIRDAREINDVLRRGCWEMLSLYAGLWVPNGGQREK